MLYKSIYDNNIFIINYKCGFSTFEYLKFHEKIVIDINLDNLKDNINEYNFYIIVRNPINRLISFYKDKFIQAPRCNNEFDEFLYNECLNNYFKNYTKNDFTKNNLNINLLCEIIKNGYDSEGHLVQQCEGDYKIITELGYKINVLKLEEKNFETELQHLLNYYEPLLKVNNTESVIFDEQINKENLSYLVTKFNDDFIEFNYKNDN